MTKYIWRIVLVYSGTVHARTGVYIAQDPSDGENVRQQILDFLDDLIDTDQIDYYGVEEQTEGMYESWQA